MLKKIMISTVFFLSLVSITALAHTATVENSGSGKYKSIRLTPAIYEGANTDLSDLRVLDETGETVPYFINTAYQTSYREANTYQMVMIDSYVKDEDYYFDYKLEHIPEQDVLATELIFATSGNGYAKNVELFGSYDNQNWESVQTDVLYHVESNQKNNIVFQNPLKYTHYRLKLFNNLEKIEFTDVTLLYNVETFQRNYFVEEMPVKFDVETVDKQTTITLYGLKNLKLNSITLETNSTFKREAVFFGRRKEIYNLLLNDTAFTDTTLDADWETSTAEEAVITISNYDDKPIEINGITVRYYADEVVFEDRGGNYTLQFGDSTASRPVYDIANYKDEVLKGQIDPLTIKEVSLTAAPEIPPEYDYRRIFNIITIVVAVLLGWVLLMKLKKK